MASFVCVSVLLGLTDMEGNRGELSVPCDSGNWVMGIILYKRFIHVTY